MPTTITSAGITFNDATSLTSAVIPANAVGATQLVNGSVTAAKLGTTEQTCIAKAWVNFDGTTSPGTIRSSYNVSSVTKIAQGAYTLNFATPMVDTNYVVTGTASISNASGAYPINAGGANGTTATTIYHYEAGAGVDSAFVMVAIFGN